MNKIENILLELFEKYPQLTTAQIVEHTALARRTVQKTIDFENRYDIEIQNTRISKKKFSASLTSMYLRRVIQLKKQGVLQELGLIEKYGGVLKRQRRGGF